MHVHEKDNGFSGRRWRVNVKWASAKHLHNLCVCVGSFDASAGVKPGSRFRRRRRRAGPGGVRRRRREEVVAWGGGGGGTRRWRRCEEVAVVRGWMDGRLFAAAAAFLYAIFIFYSRNFRRRRQTTGFGIPSKRLAREIYRCRLWSFSLALSLSHAVYIMDGISVDVYAHADVHCVRMQWFILLLLKALSSYTFAATLFGRGDFLRRANWLNRLIH